MRRSTVEAHEAGVRRAAETIAATLDEALDVERLARGAGLSASRFERVFRATLAESVAALRRRLRLERAALELSVTDLPVTAIAFRAGYDTHESFTRAFQRAYGRAPSAFRQRMQIHGARMGQLADVPYRLPAANALHVDAREIVVSSPVPLRGGESMSITVVARDALRVAVVTHAGPPNMIGEAFQTLARFAGPAGLFGEPGAHAIAVFPASGSEAALAAVAVAEGARIPDGLTESELAGGTYAMVTHVGPYATLPDAWRGVVLDVADDPAWAADPVRPSLEAYRVADHAEPSALETDLFLPVRRADGE